MPSFNPSPGIGTHPDRIGLTVDCGCPRALSFAGQGTAWTGPALTRAWGVCPQPLTHPAIGPETGTGRRVMHIQSRHWLDYDPVALAVLVIGIGMIELLAWGIW